LGRPGPFSLVMLPSVQTVRFGAAARQESTKLLVFLRGVIDSEAEPAWTAFLSAIHAEALKAGVRSVVVEFSSVEFIMSVCISRMLRWLVAVEELGQPQRYEVVLRGRGKAQERTLMAMHRLAPETSRVVIAGRAA